MMHASPGYTPRPGTVAYRALAHLETLPRGAELMTSALGEAIGISGNNLRPNLDAALGAGLVFRRQRDNHVRSPWFWSLTDHRAPVLPSNGDPYGVPCGWVPPSADMHVSPGAPSAVGSGSRNPEGGALDCAAEAGRESPPRKGANRAVSAEQSHGAVRSASRDQPRPTGAPARGAAPAFISERLDSQYVLKATGASPDATDREIPATASPVGGPMGAAQPAAAGRMGCLRIALWSDGALTIQRGAELIQFGRIEARQIVEYFEAISPAPLLVENA